MTILRWLSALVLAAGPLLAQEPDGYFTDEDIQRHLAEFDRRLESKEHPQADVVESMYSLRDAYLSLKASGERVTNEQMKLKEEILLRALKGLTAKKGTICNIECARVLGEMGDPKGAASLVAWLKGLLLEKFPNPHAIEVGFFSLAWIGPDDQETLQMVLGYATGTHPDPSVAPTAIQACYEWRALDGETRKQVFDAICGHLEKLWEGREDKKVWKLYAAIEKDALQALRELGGGAKRFSGPGDARAWFARNTKWEPYVGPRFRK